MPVPFLSYEVMKLYPLQYYVKSGLYVLLQHSILNFHDTCEVFLVSDIDFTIVTVSGKVGPMKPENHTSWVTVLLKLTVLSRPTIVE